jgi:hypothetical protein
MQRLPQAPVPAQPRRIETEADARQAVADLEQVMEGLQAVVEQETELVRTGQLRKASGLGAKKAELGRLYYVAAEQLKANAGFLKRVLPKHAGALRPRNDVLQAALKNNLMVLATAHAVSEGIVRRLSGDLARKASPQVYGASGRTAAPNPKLAPPLAVSRLL